MNYLVSKGNKNNNIETEINLYYSKAEECRQVYFHFFKNPLTNYVFAFSWTLKTFS